MFDSLLLALVLIAPDFDNGPERMTALQDRATVEDCVQHKDSNWFICQDGDITTLVHEAPLWNRTEYDIVLAAENGEIFWLDESKGHTWKATSWTTSFSYMDADDAFDDGIELRRDPETGRMSIDAIW